MKKKGKVRMWTILLVIVGVFAVGSGAALVATAGERREAKNLPIAALDFSNLKDGVYTGDYAGGMYKWRATEVRVTVAGGKVTDIQLRKGALNKEGQPAKFTQGLTINDLFGRVIQSQSLQVDTISGATLTSKAHLKAVEDALEQAEGK